MKFGKQIVAAGLATLVAGGTLVALPSQTAAQADQYERSLGSIRLNSKANLVLKYYGNPNQVVIGDVGIREAPNSGAGGTGAAGGTGFSGAPSGGGGARGRFSPSGGGSGSMAPTAPSYSGGGGFGAPAGASGPGRQGGDEAGGFGGGAPSGFPGAPSGMGGYPGAPSGMGGGFPGAPGGGGGTGQFGATVSNLTPQQETTWIYNRRAGKDVVSYEFLIGNGGVVTQIRVIGYSGGNSKTRKGIALGSTYKEVVQKYGYPEQQFQVGRSLIASYKSSHHVLFQFLNQRSQTENPFSAGNKAIAITIASVE